MKNALKYALMAAGPIVLAIGLFVSFRSDSPVADEHRFVNVVTGEMRTYKKGTYGTIPIRDEENRRVYFPVERAEDGSLVIGEYYRPLLPQLVQANEFSGEELVVDLETYVIERD